MTVKEVISLASKMAKEEEVEKFCNGKATINSEYAKKTYDLFKDCYNIITDELATEYYPLKVSEEYSFCDGKLLFSHFRKIPLKIYEVTDKKGNKLAYRLINDYLSIGKSGDFIVTYSYRPKNCEDNDEAVFSTNIIGPYVLCYGIVCEFMLSRGNFSESNMWLEKYMKGIRGKLCERRNLKIPARRW